MHRSARTQEVRAREACSALLAQEKRSGAKVKGDEEYYREKKRPHTHTHTHRSEDKEKRKGEEEEESRRRYREGMRTPPQPRSLFRGTGALLKSCSRPF